MPSVVIPYKPRPWFLGLHDSPKRWKVVVAHRRCGKSTAAINHIQRDALKIPNSRFAFVSPTYKMSKNIAWDIVKHTSRVIPGISYNESELAVKYPNGSRLTLYGADNPDSLRGIGLWGVVFDEYSQQPSNIFSEIIRPALADHQGYAIWIGTPKGKNEFFRLFETSKRDPEWFSLLLTVDDTHAVPPEEIESARKVMTPDEFQQEWYCSFEASIKGAYYATEVALARRQGRIKTVPYDPSLPVFLVSDLGVGPNFATGFYQRASGETRMIDYWEGSQSDGIPQAIKAFKDKPYIYQTWFLPHDAEQRSTDTGKTRVQLIRELWPNVATVVIPNRLSVDDGIQRARLLWSRLWVNSPPCDTWLDAVSQYRQAWDDNRGMFVKTPYKDWTSHAADCHRYAALVEDQMTPASASAGIVASVPNLDPY